MQDKEFLNTFWDLADSRDEKRVSGAVRLLDIVVTKQTEHENGTTSTEGEDYCQELSYTLLRLVKGLASSRKGARQGYATALSEILACIDAVKVEDIFNLIKKHLQIKGIPPEQKGCTFGQIFAYIAIAQSGRLFKEPENCLKKVTTELFKLSQKKGYLEDVCTQALADIIVQCNSDMFESYIWPVLNAELKEGWEDCTPQRLHLIFVCHNQFPNVVNSKFLKAHWSCDDLVQEENFPQIANILDETASTASQNVHSICELVLSQLVKDTAKLEKFWTEAIDEHMCTLSHTRKYLAFRLLEKTLPLVKEDAVKCLFSENLLRCIMNHLANKQSRLHGDAKQLVENLSEQMKEIKSAEKQAAILTTLLERGGIQFDTVTRSKTILNLINGLSHDGIVLYITWLKSVFNEGLPQPRLKSTNIDTDRKWVCSQLLYLVRNLALPRQDGWLLQCVRFMFLHAFFKVTTVDDEIPECQVVLDEPVSEAVRTQLSQFFFSALNSLSNILTTEARSSGKPLKLMGTTSEGQLYVYEVVMFAVQLLKSEHCHPVSKLSDKMMESWNMMLAAVRKIQKRTSKDSSLSEGYAFQLLYLHIGLQLFTEPKQALGILEDLHGCQKKALQKRRSVRKKDTEDEDEEPEWIEVVTEILLSLLSQPSHLLRVVVDNVFKIICPHLTRDALQILLDVLDPSKSQPGEDNVEIKIESDSEEEDDDEEEEEEEDDVDMDDHQLTNGHHGNDDGDEEEEEDEDDMEEEDDVVDQELRQKLMDALGVNPDEESGSSSDEVEDLSDSEMFKRDELLAAALREKAAKKKQKADSKTMVAHFKLRVVDLLDIFIKKQPTNPLVLELIHPLLITIQSAVHQKEENVLAEKASALYKNKLCRMKKYPHDIQDKSEHLHQILEDLFKVAHKATSVHMVSLASSGCLFLVRVLRGNSAATAETGKSKRQKKSKSNPEDDVSKERQGMLDIAKVSQLYRNALNDFLSRRESRLHPMLFTDLIYRLPEYGWYLADLLVKYVKDGVQLYRKIQACKMLATLMGKSDFNRAVCSWKEFFTSLCDVSKEILQGLVEDESAQTTKPKYLVEVIKMMQATVRLSKKRKEDQTGLWKDFVLLSMKLEKTEVVKRSREITAANLALRGMMTDHLYSEKKIKGMKRKRTKQKHRSLTKKE
ncbi:myb-binding protein 1A-like protein [Ptychodera flava]|uniref:myb-binding protein 1A-like protein n=1 Tax=Ptychodera flava TaxID=63121 RepID=UPI00396A6A80